MEKGITESCTIFTPGNAKHSDSGCEKMLVPANIGISYTFNGSGLESKLDLTYVTLSSEKFLEIHDDHQTTFMVIKRHGMVQVNEWMIPTITEKELQPLYSRCGGKKTTGFGLHPQKSFEVGSQNSARSSRQQL